MKKNHWETFEWIRNGERGGNREGYNLELFKEFSSHEKEKAKLLLISVYNNGDVFSARGLTMLLREEAAPFLTEELSRSDITTAEMIHLTTLLSYALNDFSHSVSIINFLRNSDLKIKSLAINNLDEIRQIIPKEFDKELAKLLIDEEDANQRYKLGRLIFDISNNPNLNRLAIDAKFSDKKSERKSLLEKFSLI